MTSGPGDERARSVSNDYGNARSGSLDYASTRGNSLDFGSRHSSLDFGNHRNNYDGESYSLPYDVNISGKTRSDSCYSDNLDVSKINEEIHKLNRTYDTIDENAFLKRVHPNDYQSGIDNSPAPRVSDNFNRTYEQVSSKKLKYKNTPSLQMKRMDSNWHS